MRAERIDFSKQVQSKLIESCDVKYHTPHPWRQNIGPLTEESVKAASSPFEQAVIPTNTESHLRWHRFHIGFLKKLNEVRLK